MPTQDVSIWDENQTKAVTVVTDGVNERLAVDAKITGSTVAEKDFWQDSVEQGKAFVLTTNYISISGTAETNFLHLNNPAGSGKLVRIHAIHTGIVATVTGDNARVKYYRDPTTTANGTAITIRPLKKTGNNAVSMLAYTAPTTSALGTLMFCITLTQAWQESMSTEESFYLQAGEKALMTIQPANTGKNHSITVWFLEEPA